MRIAMSRLPGLALIGVAAVGVAATSYWLWRVVVLGGHVTLVGVILNFLPVALILLAGATLVTKYRRTAAAFWIAPLWAPAVFWGLALLSPRPTISYAGIVLVVTTLGTYAAMLIIGLPLFFFMRARNWTRLRDSIVAGVLAGLLASYVVLMLVLVLRGPGFVNWSVLKEALQPLILGMSAALGAVVSGTFWVIVRPDRTA